MILNRRTLLASLGLSLPAVAAEAASRKKKPQAKKPAQPTHRTPKVAQHKSTRRTRPAAPTHG